MAILEIPLEDISVDIGRFAYDYPDYYRQGFSVFFPGQFGFQYFSIPHLGGPPGYLLYGGYLRYKIPLDSTAVLNSASIRFRFYSRSYSPPLETTNVRIVAYNTDTAANPSSNSDAISKYEASTSADAIRELNYSSHESSGFYIFDVTEVLQEILNHVAWSSNNYVLFLHLSSRVASTSSSLVLEYEASDIFTPVLVIDYEPSVHPNDADRTVDHTLSIISNVTSGTHIRSTENTVLFIQDCDSSIGWSRTVDHRISFFQNVGISGTFVKGVESFVYIDDEWVGAKAYTKTVENQIVITHETVGNSPLSKHPFSTLTFEQDIETYYAYSVSVSNTLDINHEALGGNLRFIEHTITLTNIVDVSPELQNPEDDTSQLTIEQDIGYNVVKTRIVEHTLELTQAVIPVFDYLLGGGIGLSSGHGGIDPGGGAGQGVSPSPGIVKDYVPQTDGSVNFPPRPTFLAPDDVGAGNITLEYPTTSPTHTFELPSPLFSNREELQLTRIQRETRGGTLKTFSDESWPKVRTFRYKFDSLTTEQIEDFFTFLSQTLGQKIRMTDHEGRQWDGFIVNSQGESAQFFRLCGRTTEFDFDGVEV
jgi:hypothetical protein